MEDAALHAAERGPSGHVMAEIVAGCTARACQRLQAFQAAAHSSGSPGAAAGTPVCSMVAPGPGLAAQHAGLLAQGSPSGPQQRRRQADGAPALKVTTALPRTAAAGAATKQDADLSQQAAPVRVGSDPLASAPTGDGAETSTR